MSNFLSDRDAKLRISSPHKKFKNRKDVDATKLALSVEIPYCLLKEWHGKVTDKTDPEATAPGYTSLANDLIPGHCVQISQDSGQRINGNLVRKAGEVKTLYKKARNSRERGELGQKKYKLNIFEDEIVSLEGVEEELICTRQEIEEWKRKVEDLEQKKTELVEALQEALREKDEYIKEKEKDIVKLTEQNQELHQQHHINALEERLGELGCTGKKLGELSSKQRETKGTEKTDRHLYLVIKLRVVPSGAKSNLLSTGAELRTGTLVYEVLRSGVDLFKRCGPKTWKNIYH